MQIALGQWYNVGKKPTVILYIYINRHVGRDTRKTLKTKDTVTHGSSNIHYKGCKYKATTWYLNGFPAGSNLGSTV